MTGTKRTDYLEEMKRKRGRVKEGKKIITRAQLRGGFRFLVDTAQTVVHDLAREKYTCDLEQLFLSDTAETYTGSLDDAVSAGFRTCECCIGESARDTFKGVNTVLLVMNLPPRRHTTHVDTLLERENITTRLFAAYHNNRADRAAIAHALNQHRATAIFAQGRRASRLDLQAARWGNPDASFSFNSDITASLPPDDDVPTDVFIPRPLLQDEPDPQEYARSLLKDLMSAQGVEVQLARHARRYGYRNLAIYGHAVESIDECVAHHADPRCSCQLGFGGDNTVFPDPDNGAMFFF